MPAIKVGIFIDCKFLCDCTLSARDFLFRAQDTDSLRFIFYRNSFVADNPNCDMVKNGVYPCHL